MALANRFSRLSSLSICKRCLSLNSRMRSKLEFRDTMESQKTTINLGAEGDTVFQPTGLFVGGFRFGDHNIIGSIALLQTTVLRWNVASVKEINEKSLSLFGIIFPPLEIIVIGTGTRFERLDPKLCKIMRQRGIALEVQDTKNACGTYNLLQQERKGLVGAALLPLREDLRPQLPKPEKRKRLLADTI